MTLEKLSEVYWKNDRRHNMGSGFWMVCPKCKERYSFSSGVGMLSLRNNTEKYVYYCPKCGSWENVEIKKGPSSDELFQAIEDLQKGIPLPELKYEKEHEEVCPRCNTQMEILNGCDIDHLPLLVCKKCNEKLKYYLSYFWD